MFWGRWGLFVRAYLELQSKWFVLAAHVSSHTHADGEKAFQKLLELLDELREAQDEVEARHSDVRHAAQEVLVILREKDRDGAI